MSVRTWIVAALIAMPLLGVDRFVPSPLAAADQAADVVQQARAALGGEDTLGGVKTLSLEGPFSRAMGERRVEGTLTLLVALPDRLRRTEETEMPNGAIVERIAALAGDTAWDDVQNHGGMGGMQMMIFRGPEGRPVDEQRLAEARARRMKAELQRWVLSLLVQSAQAPAYAGVAKAAEGSADVLEVKDERGQPVRLFLDSQTHLPLMLTFQEIRPRMMINGGGPGGRGRGARGGNTPPPDREELRRRLEAQGPPKPNAIAMYFSDYRAEDGVMLPRRITQSVDGTPSEEWTIEKVKVNPSVKPELFEKKGK